MYNRIIASTLLSAIALSVGAGAQTVDETSHMDTVSVMYDAMRRPILQVQGYLGTFSSSDYINAVKGSGAASYTITTYDSLGRPAAVSAYDLQGDAESKETTNSYLLDDEPCSASGQVCLTISPDGAFTYTSYDALDRVDEVRQQMASGEGDDRITKTFYDVLGRVETVVQGYGTAYARLYQHYTYTVSGQIASVMDANCNMTLYTYDGFDRLSAVYFPPKEVTVPDPDDNMGSSNYDYCLQQDGNGDYVNANAQANIPGTGEGSGDREEYYYDANGNMLAKRTRRGDWISHSYDALNRLTETKTYVGGSWSGSAVTSGTLEKTVSYSYHLDGRDDVITQTAGSNFGDAGSYTVPQVTLTYAYDSAGRPTGETIDYPDSISRTVAYELDEAGNRTAIAYPEDTVASPTIDITYDERGLFDVMTVGSHSVAYSYDGFGRRTGATYTGANDVARDASYSYFRDDALKSLKHAFGAGSDDSTQQDVEHSFGYNKVNQIKNTSISNLNYIQSQTTYEQVDYISNGLNQYTKIDDGIVDPTTPLYDDSGNMIFDGEWTHTYDVENRLVKSREGTETPILYQYGPKGRRLIKDTANGTLQYMYDGDEPIADYTIDAQDNEVLLRHYVNGASVDERVLYIDKEANKPSLFYHANHQGSIIAMTCASTIAGNSDGECGTGEHVQSIITYDAYGNMGEGASGGQDFRYTGRRYDEETGLYYYRARYYSAKLGRFMQTDPIGYEDNMNLYGYTANDPVNATDPTGEWAWDVAFAVVGAAMEAYDQYSETGSVSDWGAVGEAAFDATTIGTAVNTISAVASGEQSVGEALVDAAVNKVGGKFAKKLGGCCFVAGTQVLTEDGLKNIEDIKVGDLVWSRNPETGEQELKEVTDFIPRHERVIWELTVQNESGETETFETTDEHPWWVDGQGWKRTDELTFGMRVEDDEQRVLVVTSVRNTERKDGTYNLTVADFHTYFVGELKVLVHNCKKKSVNQMNQDIKRGKAPDTIVRVDKGNTNTKTQDHVHFKDGTSMNKDGTVHDKKNGTPKLTKNDKRFLKDCGWPTECK